ncbi:MAG: hypothetical protein N3E46_02135 [Gemmataceae bacterium]|uniref:TlpA family protein disulfide reductase n=1 Tax=Thermogemmata fonticola TaxID=2755323 RepID=A0A7V8VD86_9BACT|nr:hypothetical protein [Thermogemmata fonticola]MBA2225904.1 hypothetical protein [Thermogemmata fonticola]MCX8138462.1 hypothetical protein [Gemmataceae bacterium]
MRSGTQGIQAQTGVRLACGCLLVAGWWFILPMAGGQKAEQQRIAIPGESGSDSVRCAGEMAGSITENWRRGLEAVYRGEVVEEVHQPGREFRRQHQLEVRVLCVGNQGRWTDLAVVTRLRRQEDGLKEGILGIVQGGEREECPALMRIDWLRLYSDGRVRQLLPEGPPPLTFTDKTPSRDLPTPPVDSFPLGEWWMFPPTTDWRAGEASRWSGGRLERWEQLSPEAVHGERCSVWRMRLEGELEAGAELWHRQDIMWVSKQDGISRKVNRRIERRSGRHALPWAWVETHYELVTMTPVSGRRWERLRRDLDVAYCALRDATALAPFAGQLGPRLFEQRLARLEACLDDGDAADPYRELLVAAQQALEAAQRGQRTVAGEETFPQPAHWPKTGETAPDINLGKQRLASWQGQVVLLIFLAAEGETTELTLAIAHALQQRYGHQAAILPLLAWGDKAATERLLQRRGWKLDLYDGQMAARHYTVTTVPRFLLLDKQGIVRWSFSGAGPEVGYLIREQLQRLLTPSLHPGSPDSPGSNPPTNDPPRRPRAP